MGVATAVAIGGLAVSAASTTMSFVQAGEQKKKQREAEAKAAEAMAEARKKLEINFAKELAIQKEPYELEREAMLAQGALAMQAGVESDRGAETTAGKLQMAQNQAQAGIRSAMGQELQGIEEKIINEESRLRDVGVQLDLGEVEGAQLAARDAEEASAQAMTEGFQGVASTLQQGLDMVPLFQKTAGDRQTQKLGKAASKQGISQADFQSSVKGLASGPKFGYLSGLGAEGVDFNAFMSGLSREQVRGIGKGLGYKGY
jgi:hypothetical protein